MPKSNRKSIYVESLIRADIDAVWLATQDPERHQRWDLRFSRIEYLPRRDPAESQHFLYATRIGWGKEIRGEGESVGERVRDGSRTSALKFWSDDRFSLIRSGSGYWKYVGTAEGVRFLTLYDYEVRFGSPGRLVDALLFRPLLGWATAWSFDRLRVWLENEIPPDVSLRQTGIHAITRTTVAAVWIYQGLVPKWLARDPGELALLVAAGVPADRATFVLRLLGAAEIVFGAAVLATWPKRWPLAATVALMALALAGVALTAPAELAAAFNPVSFNVSVAALSAAALLSSEGVPLARRCLRRRPENEP